MFDRRDFFKGVAGALFAGSVGDYAGTEEPTNTSQWDRYMHSEAEIDTLEGPYLARGVFDSDRGYERLEVGVATDSGYDPLFQLKLTEPLEIDSPGKSYLDTYGFTGSIYRLRDHEYAQLRELVE